MNETDPTETLANARAETNGRAERAEAPVHGLSSALLVRTEEELKELSSYIAHLMAPQLRVEITPRDEVDFRQSIQRLYDSGVRHFATCGGDGSLNRLVNALMCQGLNAESSIGVVPMGTANDFATALGGSADLELAVSQALYSPIKKIDVAQVEDRYFINVLSGGNPAKVTREVSSELKSQLGSLAYLLNGLKELTHLELYSCRVTALGETKDYELSGFAIGNGQQAGGGFKVGEACELDDAKLEVMLIPEISAPQMAELIVEAKKLEPLFSFDYLRCFKTDTIRIECDRSIPLNLDGEAWERDRLTVRVLPRSLGLSLPRHAYSEEE